MNTQTQAQEAVIHSLGVVLDNPSLNPRMSDHLQHDLGLDSMTFLHLALDLEAFLGAPLGENPEQLPETVKDLVDLVDLRLESHRHVA